MVPHTPAELAAPPPTYIIQNQPAAQAAPAKKKDPAERWYLQSPSLYRLAEIQGPDELPKIWKTLAPLTKEASGALYIKLFFRNKPRRNFNFLQSDFMYNHCTRNLGGGP